MQSDVRLLALSRMDTGFCIAGIPKDSSRWVRPVKARGNIEARELVTKSGDAIEPLDLVQLELLRAKVKQPHVEDWVANFLRRPVIMHRPVAEERMAVLEQLAEDSPEHVLRAKVRSLALIETDSIDWVQFDPMNERTSYQLRLAFSANGTCYEGESSRSGFPCTDLRLRNWSRRYDSAVKLADREFKQALEVERVFLAIGLTRLYQNNYWPMIVGFHTQPDYTGRIDLANP